jgi:hypothetical protein
MASTTPLPDPAELYIARLGTPHSQATARSALRAVAHLLGVETIDWSVLTYADLARVRAGLNRYSTSWGNTCWTVTRQCLIEARRVGTVDARMVEDVLALPRLRGSSGRLGRDLDDDEVAALLVAVTSDSVRSRRDGALPRATYLWRAATERMRQRGRAPLGPGDTSPHRPPRQRPQDASGAASYDCSGPDRPVAPGPPRDRRTTSRGRPLGTRGWSALLSGGPQDP